jgi:23S rRNA (adenine2030-N6)-methyltransferase
MNYRHAYHAGNFADVVKHVVLARVLTYMKLKPQPFRVIDTHAGAGRYDLSGIEALKTGEWRDGIARLIDIAHPDDVSALLQPYLDAVASVNAPGALAVYPGSPVIARRLMRAGDTLIANELHPEDFATLKHEFARDADTKVLNLDAWHAVKSLLPPKERRGVILIDPPFEKTDEFPRMSEAIGDALKRFATGVYVVWYPVKDAAAAAQLVGDAGGACGQRTLDVRLRILAPEAGLGLTETGVLVVNPPYTLRDELERLLPYLAAILEDGAGAGFRLTDGIA